MKNYIKIKKIKSSTVNYLKKIFSGFKTATILDENVFIDGEKNNLGTYKKNTKRLKLVLTSMFILANLGFLTYMTYEMIKQKNLTNHLTNKIITLESKVNKSKSKISSYESQIGDLEFQVSSYESEIGRLQSDLDNVNRDFEYTPTQNTPLQNIYVPNRTNNWLDAADRESQKRQNDWERKKLQRQIDEIRQKSERERQDRIWGRDPNRITSLP